MPNQDSTARVANPYRAAFYARQAEHHRLDSVLRVEANHRRRAPYYRWYTQGWLPKDQHARALDIGCGAGQFLYFLREAGFANTTGIDLDAVQVAYGRELGLNCVCADAISFLAGTDDAYDLITLLEVLEHFTLSEAFPLLQAVVDHLKPGGSLILSVPNAESPAGFATRHADITHERAFTPTELTQLFLVHGLRHSAFRDPFPAPVSTLRRVYRSVVHVTRFLESLRLRALGVPTPAYWSSVLWAVAVKP
jgi:2-polyprenyl-3-methyl-5-hydroxy-6-metoxy-1,4-benzoquinol methylase